MTSHQIIHHH